MANNVKSTAAVVFFNLSLSLLLFGALLMFGLIIKVLQN